MTTKELSKWLKEKIEFLVNHQDGYGAWKKLDEHYCVVLEWQEGYGKEKRDDVIQLGSNNDYGLNAGIKIYDGMDMEDWIYPWENETSMLVVEPMSVTPNENFNGLATSLLKQYEETLKGVPPGPDGSIDYSYKEAPEHFVELSVEDNLDEAKKKLKEAKNDSITTDWEDEMYHRTEYMRDDADGDFKDHEVLSILQHLTDKEWDDIYRELAEGILDYSPIWDNVSEYVNDNFSYIIDRKFKNDPRRLTGTLSEKLKEDTEKEVVIKPLSTEESIKAIDEGISYFLRESEFFIDTLNVEFDANEQKFILEIAITGDWKHDHMRLEKIVHDWLNTTGIEISGYSEEIIEDEDNPGSEYYDAKHKWYLKLQ